jgi:high-affinity iron transporter
MIVMTNFILLIGAGLFSKAVWDFQEHMFNAMVSESLSARTFVVAHTP